MGEYRLDANVVIVLGIDLVDQIVNFYYTLIPNSRYLVLIRTEVQDNVSARIETSTRARFKVDTMLLISFPVRIVDFRHLA